MYRLNKKIKKCAMSLKENFSQSFKVCSSRSENICWLILFECNGTDSKRAQII